MRDKVDSVSQEIGQLTLSIDQDKEDLNDQAQLLNKLDSILAQGLPIDQELHERTNKVLKISKWRHRLAKLKKSKSVTLKQLESLLKESKAHVIQDDGECKETAIEVEKQYQLCKLWLARYERVEDFNDLNVVQALINQAVDQLKFDLEEFT